MTSSEPIKTHLPCPECNSSDALAEYSDHTYCFSCDTHSWLNGENQIKETRKIKMGNFVQHQPTFSRKRKLNKETFSRYSSGVGSTDRGNCHVFNYYDKDKELVAQKVRYSGKKFEIVGDISKAGLFGQHLYPDGGRRVVVTEGEIDAMSVSQIQDHKWAVVSIPNGASGARKAVARNIEWLCKYDHVVFCFDMDDQGRKAANQCAALLPAGKAKITTLTRKDANEMLMADESQLLVDSLWKSRDWRPDGILAGTDLWDLISKENTAESVPYPWSGMNEMTHGLRKGELVTYCSGSGVGKSLVCKEIGHHLLNEGKAIGYIALEESVRRTALGFMGIHHNKPLHLMDIDNWDEYKEGFEKTVGSGNFYCFDHFGSLDSENLFNRIRYMAVACECEYIFLDHLSIVVSGIESLGQDERRAIDKIMTKLRQLVEELGIGMILVSHLKRIDGKAHEEGGKTSLSHLRGSHAIAQLSDMVIGLERNQQGDETERNITIARVLKNRYSGQTGVCTAVRYDEETGRLSEFDAKFEDVEGETETHNPF